MAEKARILFVDDEKRVLNSMRGLFRREYELFLTCEGAEAVKIAAENDVDVIVADQRMPGMTGVEVLAKVKERSPRTVRVLLTGYADPSAVEGSINDGEVFRFLSKPCPPKMLRETLSLAISASRTAPVSPTPEQPPATVAQEAAPAVSPAEPPPATTAPEPAPAAMAPEPPAPVLINDNDETQPSMRALDESAIKSTSDQTSSHWQSVTSVIMSEDKVEETQETVGLTPLGLNTADVGVVIFTIDSEFATTAIRAASADRNTILATTLSKVAQAIEEQNAGVLVTDYKTNNAILKKIIAALKQRMPHLVTIVVSDGRDTTDMIGLINFGQVFRYVLKPVDPVRLRSDMNAAVMHHLYLLSNPESAKRHQVINKPVEAGGSSTTVNRFLGRIENLPPRGTDPTDTIT